MITQSETRSRTICKQSPIAIIPDPERNDSVRGNTEWSVTVALLNPSKHLPIKLLLDCELVKMSNESM